MRPVGHCAQPLLEPHDGVGTANQDLRQRARRRRQPRGAGLGASQADDERRDDRREGFLFAHRCADGLRRARLLLPRLPQGRAHHPAARWRHARERAADLRGARAGRDRRHGHAPTNDDHGASRRQPAQNSARSLGRQHREPRGDVRRRLIQQRTQLAVLRSRR